MVVVGRAICAVILGFAALFVPSTFEAWAKPIYKQTVNVNEVSDYSGNDFSEITVFSDDEVSGLDIFMDLSFQSKTTAAKFCVDRKLRFSLDENEDGLEDLSFVLCESGTLASGVKTASGLETGCRVKALVVPESEATKLHLAVPAYCQAEKFFDLGDFKMTILYTKGDREMLPLGVGWRIIEPFKRGGVSLAIGDVNISDARGDIPARIAKFGDVLVADTNNWDSGSKLSYQWGKFSWGGRFKANPEGNKSSYKISAADIGSRLYLQVCARQTGAITECEYAYISKIIALEMKRKPSPSVTGNPEVGKTLYGKPGVWDAGVTIKVSWLRNGSLIKGQTAPTYKITSLDKGKKITFRVTATKPGYFTEVRNSASKSVSK